MKKNRTLIGLPSVLISLLFLVHGIYFYCLQQKYHLLWQFPITLKTSLSIWIVALLLLLAGVLNLFKIRHSQFLYALFGISVIIEVFVQIIYYGTISIFIDYFLILPLFLGIFSLMIVTSEKWKKRLGWEKSISLKIWFIYIIIAFLISGLPRLILDYPVM